MSVTQSIKNIYKGPFAQYLRISDSIGGAVQEQSKLVDILFLLQINFLGITQKYRKPIHEQEQNIFIRPISIQIRRIKRSARYTLPVHITHLNLVNETVEMFDWIQQTNIEEFMIKVKNNIAPHLSKLKNELLKLDTKHVDWIYSWNECIEGMTNFITNFYGGGLIWKGTDELPTYLLGDIPETYKKLDHLKLFQEINQGENITSILRQTRVNNEETSEE